MKLDKGWILDLEPHERPLGSWSNARNMVYSKKSKRIVNESGFELDYQDTKNIIGRIEVSDRLILFSTDGNISEIGQYTEADGYIVILKSFYLNFNDNYPIGGTYRFNNAGELIIVWNDNYNPPRLLNIDNLPFTLGYSEKIIRDRYWSYLNISLVENSEYRLSIIDTEGTNTTGIHLDNGASITRSNWENFFAENGQDRDEFTSTYNCDRIGIRPNGYTYLKLGITDLTPNSKWLMDGDKANLLQLFNNSIIPNLETELISESSELLTGIYYFAIAYKIGENDFTNWILINKPTYLTNIKISEIQNTNVRDLIRNEINNAHGLTKFVSKKRIEKSANKFYLSSVETIRDYEDVQNNIIKLTLSNLDNNYDYFKLAVIYKTSDNTISSEVGFFKLESDIFEYYYSGQKTNVEIDLSTILINTLNISTCKTLTVTNNQLALANGTFDEEIDYQKYANLIKINWTSKDYEGTGDYLNGIKDKAALHKSATQLDSDLNASPLLYNFDFTPYMGFQCDEIYAFYIHLVFKNGIVSKGFHIPGRKLEEDESHYLDLLSVVGSINEKTLESYSMYFHTKDTSDYTNKLLGYWRNIDEYYPNIDSFNSSDIAGLDYDLRGLNVRHHKMPSYKTLYNGHYIADVSGDANAVRKVIGININNIIIPNTIQNDIIGFKISYAKRTLSNSTIVDEIPLVANYHCSNDTPAQKDWYPYYRGYSYALLSEKPSINVSYLKAQFLSKSAGYTENNSDRKFVSFYSINGYPIVNNDIQAITETSFLPENNMAALNELREECIKLEFNTTLNTNNNFLFGKLNPAYCYIGSMVSLKRNVYYPFYEQELIECSDVVLIINNSNNYSVENIFNGDTTFRVDVVATTSPAYGAEKLPDDRDSIGKPGRVELDGQLISGRNKIFYFITQSRYLNIGDNIRYSKFYTRYNNTIDIAGGSNGSAGLYWGYLKDNESKEYIPSEELKWNKFNYDLSWLEKLKYLLPNNPYNIFENIFANRLWRSLKFEQVDESIGWRRFLINEYYDITRNKGYINNLEALGDVLFIHTPNTLFLAKLKDVILTNNSSIYLGSGDLFDRPPSEVIADNIGYAGNKNQFGTCICKHGYIFPSREQGKIFLVSDGIKEISNEGISSVIEYYLKDIYTNTESEYNFINGDNPYKNNGIAIGYEELNNRILISIKNEQYEVTSYEEEIIEGLKSRLEIVFTSATPSSTITLDLFDGEVVNNHTFSCVNTIVNQTNEFIFNSDGEVVAASFLLAINSYLALISATSLYTVQINENKIIIEASDYDNRYNYNPVITGGLYVKASGVDNAGTGAAAQEWCPEGHYVNGLLHGAPIVQSLYTVQEDNTTVLLLVCPRDMPDAFELLIAPAGTIDYVKVATTSTFKLNNQGTSSNYGYPNTGDFFSGTPSGATHYNSSVDIVSEVVSGLIYNGVCPCYSGSSNQYAIPPLYHKNLNNTIFIGEDKPKDDDGFSACTYPRRNVYSRLDEFNLDNDSELTIADTTFTSDGKIYKADNGDGMQLLWKLDCYAGDKIKVRAIGASNATGYCFNLRQILNQSSVITESHINNYKNVINKPIFEKTGVDKSITLSYSFEIIDGKWVSRHDYICSAYMRTMDKLYYLLNNSLKFHIYRPSLVNWGGFEVEQDARVIHFASALDDSVNEGVIIDSQSLQNGKLTNASCLLMIVNLSTINLPNTIEINSETLTYNGTAIIAVDSINKFQLKTTKSGKLYNLSFSDIDGLEYHFSCAEIYKNVSRLYYYIHNSLFYGSVALVIHGFWSVQNEYFYLQEFGYDKTTNSAPSNESIPEYIIVPKLQTVSPYSSNRAAYLTGFDSLNPFIPNN